MQTFVSICAVGAEKILGNEIKKQGFSLVSNSAGQVTFQAGDEAMYRANLVLRTSDKIFLQLAEYQATNFDDFFEGVYEIEWEKIFYKNARIVVDKVRAHNSRLESEHTLQSMAHKAICNKLMDVYRMRSLPETGSEARVRIYIEKNIVRVLLDSSGDALHKRGYRAEGGSAPLRETTAAVLLHELLWRRKTPLVDPFCGSGTIAIEAMLFAYNIAPGIDRRFAYENFLFYDEKLDEKIRAEEAMKIRTDVEVKIFASDINRAAVDLANQNAERACEIAKRALNFVGRDEEIIPPKFFVSDFCDLKAEYDTGLILANPPYGMRMGDADEAEILYKKMSVLWENFPSWNFGFITSHKKFQEGCGHYAPILKNLRAGNLDTKLYIYMQNKKSK